MLKNLFPNLQRTTPTLLVTEKVMRDMAQEVLDHPDTETAWGLAGFYFDGGNTVIVTNVIRPDSDEVSRKYTNANLGGDLQVEALRWLSANAHLIISTQHIQTNARYAYLFKGHSHHQLGYSVYSNVDHASILESVEKDGLEVAIGPLANIKAYRSGVVGPRVDGQYQVDFQFYYLSKKMLAAGQRTAIIVSPTIINETDVFMPIPQLGWQFSHREDYLEQLRQLKHYGCKVNVVTRDVVIGPPMEIQFIVSKPNVWRGSLSIATAADYPDTPPKFEVLSPSGPSKVAFLWITSPEKQKGELWNADEDFLESVFRLEARGEL